MHLSTNSIHPVGRAPVVPPSVEFLPPLRGSSGPTHFVDLSNERYHQLSLRLNAWVNDPHEKSCLVQKRNARQSILSSFITQSDSLSLHASSLHSIPPGLSELALRYLYLGSNSLDYSDPPAIAHPFSGMDKLENLDMRFNSIIHLRGLDISSLRNLRSLNLSDNSIRSFSSFPKLSIFPHLTHLILTSNSISCIQDLDLKECVNLYQLSLDYNRISDVSSLDLSDCNRLVRLDLDRNEIRTFNPTLPTRASRDLRISLLSNLLCPRQVADINALQNSTNYVGPRYSLSVTSEVQTDVSLADLPEIISHWMSDATPLPWLAISELPPIHPDTVLFKNMALFLNRLFNETPKSLEGIYPDEIITHHVRLFIKAVTEVYPSVSLLRECSLIAEECVSTCTDLLRIGLIQISLRAFRDLSEKEGDTSTVSECEYGLSCISSVSGFIRDLNKLKIVFDNKLQKFLGVQHIIFPHTLSETDAKKNLDSMSLEDRLIAITSLTDSSINYKIFTVGDEVEDILCLLNQLKTYGIANIDDFHMRYGGCVTLNDRHLQRAAIEYIFNSSS